METKRSANKTILVGSDELVAETEPSEPEHSLASSASPTSACAQKIDATPESDNLSAPTESEQVHKSHFFHQIFAGTRAKFILFIIAIGVATNVISTVLSDRSKNESLFRQYVDEAQLFEMNKEDAKARHSWQLAIDVATKLGDGNKSIADLYVRKSLVGLTPPFYYQEQDADRSLAQTDLRKAIALYDKEPNTTLQRIHTRITLLNCLSTQVDDGLSIGYSGEESHKLAESSHALLRQKQIAPAIESYTKYLALTKCFENFPAVGPKAINIVDDVAELETMLKNRDPLAETALPLMHDAVYYDRGLSCGISNVNDTLLMATSLLDQTIAKTGRNPDRLETRRFLADRAFARQEYRTASVEYQRCLGMKDDPAVRSNLQECYRRLHKPAPDISQTLATLTELKKLHIDSFGENSQHVTKIIREFATAYLAAGDFPRAEEMAKIVLTKACANPSRDPNLPEGMHRAFWSLLDLYVIQGKFKSAEQLYNESRKEFARTNQDIDLKGEYAAACIRAGWFKDYLKLRKSDQQLYSPEHSVR